ncbi:MAG TPA: Gfo/Idh/MocA family oxidoreductase, partial [Candidatus Nanoarchaeia archaeon]|nr:Gfo/Idh/MocA family oxidoreductase [Candidatus Nanoarchaeia archaeon]
MFNVGVIGAGTWGKNHIRVWSELSQVKLVAVADSRPEVAQRLATQYHITGETDYRALLHNPEIQAVSICTPSSTHYAVAKEALEAG